MRTTPLALLAALLLLPACDSQSSNADGSAAADGSRQDAATGDATSRDDAGPTPDSGPQPDIAVPKVTWTIAAKVGTDIGWENGVLATHPTQPNTIAVKREVSQFEPDVAVVLSADLGKNRTPVTIKSYANAGPGHYDNIYGFGFDPSDGNRLALLTLMPPKNPNNPGEPEWDTLVFATSTTGGASFAVHDLRTNPWPPDAMALVGGKTPRLAVRSQHVLMISENFGQGFSTVFDDSKLCLAHGGFAVSPVDEPLTFLMICNATLLRCERAKSATKPSCTPAQLPSGFTASSVAIAPNDAARVIAAGTGGLAVSTDGGKTFARASAGPSSGARKIVFDPRPGEKTVYAHAPAGNKVYRSLDGGDTYQDVTPPTSLDPPIGSYARDIAVAADGALIALAHPGVIRLPPP